MPFQRGRHTVKPAKLPLYSEIEPGEIRDATGTHHHHKVRLNYEKREEPVFSDGWWLGVDNTGSPESSATTLYRTDSNGVTDMSPGYEIARFHDEKSAEDAAWQAYSKDKAWQTRVEDAFGNGATQDDPRYDDIDDEDE